MRRLLSRMAIAALLCCSFAVPGNAHARDHYYRHHYARHHHHRHHRYVRRIHRTDVRGVGHFLHGFLHLVTVKTLAGSITVAADAADRLVGVTNALVRAGFRGPVHCYAAHGHMPNSLHHTGHACDFAQTGWNKTVPIMYHAHNIIASFGLRDGCDFRHPRKDCGHVDTGFSGFHYARRHHPRIHYAAAP